MPQYRYVGSAPAAILDTNYLFQRYGQLVEMPEELAHKVITEGRIALITAEEFDSLGHSPKELQFHGKLETHAMDHPDHPEFHRRKAHAWAKLDEFRNKLKPKPEEESTDA